MAEIKISALPTATTPLTGAELVPIVQSGVTKQTTTSDVLAAPVTSLTASSAVATDASKKLVSVANTGTGNNVLATGPTITLANATGLPLSTGVTGTLPVSNGGNGTASPSLVAGTNVTISGTWPNQTINSTGGGGGGSGTVTSVSVTTANGLAGTVANATTTPAITLSTSVVGVVKGNGSSLSAATAGTDYVAPGGALGTPSSGTLTNASGLPLTTGVSGILPIANGGTNTTATPTAGTVAVGTGTAVAYTLAGTAGQVLTSAGAGTPYWSTGGGGGGGSGTVTNVSALTLGTTGTDLSSTVANPTTTPVITLNVPTASATNRGVMSTSDWSALLGSKTANNIYAAPNGSAGAPTFRAMVAADVPTLNQNTTGTAANVTGTVQIANGGTGSTTAATARTNLGLGSIATQDSSNVSISGGSINGTSVGSITAAAGAFTTLSASSTVSGTGFSTYLASPPAIGGTAAAAGSFTALSYSTTLTGGTGIVNLGSGQFYKDASGNVGIGTSIPAYPLHVNGTGLVSSLIINGGGTYAAGSIYSDASWGMLFRAKQASPSQADFRWSNSADVERMRIDASGNVGINKTSPSTKLEIQADASEASSTFAGGTTITRVNSGPAASWSAPRLDFGENTTKATAYIASKNEGNGGGSLIFGNRDTSSTTSTLYERLRINPTGAITTSGSFTTSSLVSAGGGAVASYGAITSNITNTGISWSGGQLLDVATITNNGTINSNGFMNPTLSPITRVNVGIGSGEKNSPTAMLLNMDSNSPFTGSTIADQCITSLSVRANTDSSSGQKRSVWGINVEARQGGGAGSSAENICGIEVDMLNEGTDSPSTQTTGHTRGYWAQANTSTGKINGTAFFASVNAGGWRNALYVDGNITDYLAFLNTSNTSANGILVNTSSTSSSQNIIDCRSNAISKFTVKANGDTLSIGPIFGVANTTAGQSGHLKISSGTVPSGAVDGSIWFDGTNLRLYVGGTSYTITKT